MRSGVDTTHWAGNRDATEANQPTRLYQVGEGDAPVRRRFPSLPNRTAQRHRPVWRPPCLRQVKGTENVLQRPGNEGCVVGEEGKRGDDIETNLS